MRYMIDSDPVVAMDNVLDLITELINNFRFYFEDIKF